VHLFALGSESEAYGLSPEDAGTSFGPGDDSILACVAALRGLQSVGKIRRVGLAGYPLPVLLRLSRLVLARTGTPIDVVQTYAHQTVLCDTLGAFLPALAEARVPQVVSAAPLSMGLLTAGGGPAWHPARRVPALFDATREAVTLAREQGNGVSIEAAACAYGYKPLEHGGAPVPVVIGCTNLDQVHLTLRAFGEVQRGEVSADNLRVQEELVKLFEGRGVRNVSWQSPAPEAFPAEA
jgi:aryl-alcohol dehydrogenase-like predicted oxidoreductase